MEMDELAVDDLPSAPEKDARAFLIAAILWALLVLAFFLG